jgi:hypothetical protein
VSQVLLHVGIALLGIFAVFIVSFDVQPHVRGLRRHFESGNWEITGTRAALEDRLRLKYSSEPAKWRIHRVAGSAHALLLDRPQRAETIRTVGLWVLRDTPEIDHQLAPLWSMYRGFLNAALLELASRSKATEARTLTSFAERLLPSPLPRSSLKPDDYQRVNKALSRLPRTDSLKNALAAFRDHEQGVLGLRAFAVATLPQFDADGEWERNVTRVDKQESRCLGEIRRGAESNESVPASLSSFSRLLEVELVRPWLSDHLLDEYSVNRLSAGREYFNGPERKLGVIPSRLWVLMADEIIVQPEDKAAQTTVADWAREPSCCMAVCANQTLSLDPGSPVRLANGDLRFIRRDAPPLLYAIVSRVRH